jgi:NhaP-type Na+/H+ or K+/H+ antiporter
MSKKKKFFIIIICVITYIYFGFFGIDSYDASFDSKGKLKKDLNIFQKFQMGPENGLSKLDNKNRPESSRNVLALLLVIPLFIVTFLWVFHFIGIGASLLYSVISNFTWPFLILSVIILYFIRFNKSKKQ